jgi:hypothetical protein
VISQYCQTLKCIIRDNEESIAEKLENPQIHLEIKLKVGSVGRGIIVKFY